MSGDSGSRTLRWPLRITEQRSEGIVIFELSGRLGHAAADSLTAALGTAIHEGNRRLVLDFSQVDYISSAGLLAVDLAAAQLAAVVDGTLVLCDLPESVRLTFDLAGFLTRFPIEPTRERAVARLAQAG